MGLELTPDRKSLVFQTLLGKKEIPVYNFFHSNQSETDFDSDLIFIIDKPNFIQLIYLLTSDELSQYIESDTHSLRTSIHILLLG